MNKNVEYIIVGQGLAGSFLAFQLMQRNKRFLIVDQGHEKSSSFVAAGILNPLVLKRYTKTWRADEFLAYNQSFFSAMERLLGKKYFHPLPINKLISSEDEENFWQHRYEKEDLEPYLEKEIIPLDKKYTTPKQYKVGKVKQTAWLNISQLLTDLRAYFIAHEMLIDESLDITSLSSTNEYSGIKFKKLVFCEGAAVKANPYFNSIPFSSNKGQLITIKSLELPSDAMLKKSVFILPIGNSEFKVGASYAWEWENEDPEPEQTDYLKNQLEEMVDLKYDLVKAHAGIRPTIKDRRPVLGEHPKRKNFYIFNGMGSKGCFMAPLLSEELINNIEKGSELDPETNILRYASCFE